MLLPTWKSVMHVLFTASFILNCPVLRFLPLFALTLGLSIWEATVFAQEPNEEFLAEVITNFYVKGQLQKVGSVEELILPHYRDSVRFIKSFKSLGLVACDHKDQALNCVLYDLQKALDKINKNKDLSLTEKLAAIKDLALYDYENRYEKFSEIKSRLGYTTLKILPKSYNGSEVKFQAVGDEKTARNIFFENYKRFGPNFTHHFPLEAESALGALNKRVAESLVDLMILRGKSSWENTDTNMGIGFCFLNTLKKEASTVGAASLLDDLCLCATTNIDLLKTRQKLLLSLVTLLEDPAQSTELEKILKQLEFFEADFLGISDDRALAESIWGDNFRRIFYKASESLRLNQKQDLEDEYDSLSQESMINKIFQPANDVLAFMGRSARSFARYLNNNVFLLNVFIPIAIYKRIKEKFSLPGHINDIFTKDSEHSRNGISLSDIAYALGLRRPGFLPRWQENPEYGNLRNFAQRAIYCLFIKKYFSAFEDIVNCFSPIPTKAWFDGWWTLDSLLPPTRLFDRIVEEPLLAVERRAESLEYGIKNIFKEVGWMPGTNIRKFFDEIKECAHPTERFRHLFKELMEELPNAFINSYNQLIGVTKFFKAVTQLCRYFQERRECFSDIVPNLKLFNHLLEFAEWQTNLPTERSGSFIDYYHANCEKACEEKLERLQVVAKRLKEPGFVLLNNDADERILEEAKSRIKLLEKAKFAYKEKLECENAGHVGVLLRKLRKKLFCKKATFFYEEAPYLRFDYGKISATYKSLIDLRVHFYPMYQAVSELLAMIALAKKIVKSKRHPHNKYCFVDFVQSTATPSIKVVNGWNPTAIPSPENGFDHIVPSSFALGICADGKEQHMLLTGPNGKGKSTFMRGVCYQIWAAQTLGIAPAEALTMTPFHFLFSLRKDVEDAASANSTHMAQVFIVKDLRDYVNKLAAEKRFAWLSCDELFSGTVSVSASADTCLFLKYLPPESICCVATHQREAPAAQEITGGRVVCYKVNPVSKQLEKGVMDMVGESTNTQIMTRFGYTTEEIEEVRAFEKTFIAKL